MENIDVIYRKQVTGLLNAIEAVPACGELQFKRSVNNFIFEPLLSTFVILLCLYFVGGHAVVQLVEALCYKSEGHGLDSR
jgi:hypothetical protein